MQLYFSVLQLFVGWIHGSMRGSQCHWAMSVPGVGTIKNIDTLFYMDTIVGLFGRENLRNWVIFIHCEGNKQILIHCISNWRVSSEYENREFVHACVSVGAYYVIICMLMHNIQKSPAGFSPCVCGVCVHLYLVNTYVCVFICVCVCVCLCVCVCAFV